MNRRFENVLRLLGAGLLLSTVGCDDAGGGKPSHSSGAPFDTSVIRGTSLTSLLRAADCGDLLTKIQNDAVAKLALTVESFRANDFGRKGNTPGAIGVGASRGGGEFATPFGALPTLSDSAPQVGAASSSDSASSQGTTSNAGNASSGGVKASVDGSPTSASSTNTQVAGVDEADFVKVVDNGKAMYLLHGNTLRKLATFPPEQLSLDSGILKIEGQPSEMFVTEAGQAVVFSTVYNYGHPPYGPGGIAYVDYCGPYYCGGSYGSYVKITVADVSGAKPTVVRELYYQGEYLSSRRYDDVVRVVLQAQAPHSDIFSPRVELSDPFGRPYADTDIEEQLAAWQARTEEAIRDTALADWLPLVQEAKDGKLVDVTPTCDQYFSPQAGLTDYGLTHVLSLDTKKPMADIGGVTILGSASTVYSNLDTLVLAQPDYRYDYGYVPEERTALHVFGLAKADTSYEASGWVPGILPAHNPQFGVDVAEDGTIRVGTTAQRRANPKAEPFSDGWWQTTTDNRVTTLGRKGETLTMLGQSEALGHAGERIQSARFVGDRAYVVTFRNTDPLIALDVGNPAQPKVLGEIEIPGFSEYMHPLDANHLITFGQSGQQSSQLQLFDVSDPAKAIPAPKVLDLGQGSSSEVAYNHKAFTYYAEKSLIALPVSGSWWDARSGRNGFSAGLYVVHVDADAGFTLRGIVDHAPLYVQQGCGTCDAFGCYDAFCYAQPEVRRGHFVSSAETTYVYSFSYGGVVVTDIRDFAKDVASVTLPAPVNDASQWYSTGVVGGGNGTATVGGTAGTSIGKAPPPPVATPVAITIEADAGSSTGG